jgi:UDP-GlcNAc:undecaprenyl-phosphate GlcNAc-1-phosphate transferase
MYSITLLVSVSLVLALLLTPLCRNAFNYFGIVDQPDKDRKLHAAPTPRAGGVAIAFAYVGAFGVLLLLPLQAKNVVLDDLPLVLRLLPAIAVIFVTGLLDDVLGLKPWQKLAGQCAGALLAIAGGVQVQGIGGFEVSWWLSIPLTAAWLLACTNAFNLIDGLDGLAAGIGAFAAATTLTVAIIQGHIPLAMATAPLLGALLGFLRYNFQPASVFLGDTGSLLIGFMLGSYAVLWSHKADTLFGMTAPIMVLAIPLLDTSLSICRRIMRQKPIFSADRGHIHHRLLDNGLSPRRVALSIYLVCTIAALFSLVISVLRNTAAGIVLMIFCAVAVLLVRKLGYVELSILGRVVSRRTVRDLVGAEMVLSELQTQLISAHNLDEQWAAICRACKHLGFCRIELCIKGRILREHFAAADPLDSCCLRITLAADCYVECERSLQNEQGASVIPSFARILRNYMQHPAEKYAAHAVSM